jgi:phosphatidylglycerophosphate synthase
VARAYGQSSNIGCGWDWLADILAQYNIAIWVMIAEPAGSPLQVFTVLFTTVEISTGLFDFATSTTGNVL